VNLSQLKHILLQMLLLPVLAMLLAAIVLVLQIDSAFRTVNRIQLADRNIEAATRIGSLIIDEETGLRGYTTTGDSVFLQPYNDAAPQLDPAFAQLRRGLIAQDVDPAIVDRLAAAHRDWQQTIAVPLIEATRRGSPEARATPINLAGKTRMDSMRQQINVIVSAEISSRNAGEEQWRTASHRALALVIALSLAIGIVLGLFSRRQMETVSHAFQITLNALRRTARETHASERRLRTILTSIGDAVVVCDAEGRVEMLNTVAEVLTGWTQAEAARQPLAEVLKLLDETTREPLETPVSVVMRERRVVQLSNHALLIRRDGIELHIADSGAPIWDAAGRLTGVVMVFRDVTENRRTQTALMASEKLAVAGRLAATIAHEIHNPLDAVMNLLYLLRQGTTPQETQQFLDMASAELDRVAQISRSMLGMYRESRSPVPIDLGELLESVLLLFERNFKMAGVTLVRHIDPGLHVSGYPAELRQVFTNLITNALDASPTGSALRIEAHAASSAVEITIADTGAGIPAETLPRLFQPFFTTKGEQGTGLGLWVSRGILEKHGGTIRIESSTGDPHGTTITITLPTAT
jgi:PAS domain S-box-containing protein